MCGTRKSAKKKVNHQVRQPMSESPCLSQGFRRTSSNFILCKNAVLSVLISWGFPQMGVPPNGWFMMETPSIKWMICGYPYFRKPPLTSPSYAQVNLQHSPTIHQPFTAAVFASRAAVKAPLHGPTLPSSVSDPLEAGPE